MARTRAATTTKRLTKGPRKGKTIKVYVKSGTEVRLGADRGKRVGGAFSAGKQVGASRTFVKARVSPQARRAAVAKKFAKKRVVGLRRTSDHAAAGLHRVGQSGNRYITRSGKVVHRVGKGPNSRFKSGEPPKAKKRNSGASSLGKTTMGGGRKRSGPKGATSLGKATRRKKRR